MSWPRANTGHPSGKGKEPIDVLDLTLSDSPSPEPPPSRRQAPPPRSPNPAPRRMPAFPTPHVKKEAPRPMKTEKMSASRQAPAVGVPRAPPKARISPNDIDKIIATSDPRAIAKVLSDLCKLSPALTGAVARGLAQHSTFAQTLITRYTHRQTGPSTVKPEPALPPSSPDLLDDNSSLAGSPQINILTDSEPEDLSVEDNSGTSKSGRPQEKQWRPPLRDIKLHPSPNSNPISQTRPLSTPRVGTFNRPLQIHQPVARPNAPFQPQSSPSPFVKNEQNRPSSQSVKQCTRCQRNFNDKEIDLCIYHPGRKQVASDITGRRITRYTCCKQEIDEPGCETEVGHAAPAVGPISSLKRPGSYIQDPFNIDRSKSPKLS
ncbi:hypothetical protein BCR34DRAFT_601406 [Clohesyomyces aquaticus]|uniref:Uncharacterized protein n=1 Tax=Clohesyomyces aquaticus TaxID=1231657 RepID=A0A1Y1ZM32_9PLEO|nr:hypothetical protein BCR34DRAFT_601406 [Clohesyomyces aquaticus]